MAVSGGFEPLSQVNDPNTNTGTYRLQGTGDYLWRDNGRGGVDYFRRMDNGYSSYLQPITNTEFGQATGQDYNAIEQWVTGNYNSSKQREGDNPTDPNAGSGSGSTSPTSKYGYAQWNGTVYNLDDPTQQQAFLNARNNDYVNEFNRVNGELDQNMNSDLSSAGRTYADKLNLFKKNQSDLGDQLNEYNSGNDLYSKQLYDLYEGLGQGNVKRQNYFTRLSPDTYQASQGSSAKYANDMYQRGYTDTNNARNKYFGDLNYNIATNQQGMNDLGSDYNTYLDNAKAYYANQKSQNNTLLNQNRDALTNQSIDWNNGKYNGFNFNANPLGSVSANQVDLSSFTPYINFQALGEAPRANMFSKFQAPNQTLTPLEQTLGYTPKQKDTNPLNSYLYK